MDIDQLSQEQQKKLGELLLDGLRQTKDEVKRDSVNEVVKKLFEKICDANHIDESKIRVRVFNDSEVNAFALPGDQLIVLTGLVNYCKTPEELAGVMAHEIAHIQHDHVMKKLVKEVGIAMLFAITAGNGSFEIISEVLQTVTSRAFDRDQESEADLYAVELLSKANINPVGLSDFLFRLSQETGDTADDMVIISTHPGSSDRAAAILKETGSIQTVEFYLVGKKKGS
jgi:predicted Zn-dependent protease